MLVAFAVIQIRPRLTDRVIATSTPPAAVTSRPGTWSSGRPAGSLPTGGSRR